MQEPPLHPYSLLRACHKRRHDFFAPRLVEVDGEFVAVDLGDMAITKLIMENAIANAEVA